MKIDLIPVPLSDKPVLRNLLELYQYDFSEFDGEDVGETGLFGYKYLDHYWTEPGRHPFILRVDDKLAGFVLVNRHCLLGSGEDTRAIAEFFVMRKYRRRGVGEAAASRIFRMFPGKWEVAQLAENHPAQEFWRKVVWRITGGAFEEIWMDDERWRGPVLFFECAADPPLARTEESLP